MFYESEGYDVANWPETYWRASRPTERHYPRLESTHRTDFAIIGGGYAGLNAALELIETQGAKVTVLDAAQPGWGASGRNGGFCCLGGARLSPAAIRRRHGSEAASDWDSFEVSAIDRVRDNLARYTIDAQPCEEGELLLADTPHRWQALRKAPLPSNARLLDRSELGQEGLQTAAYYGGRIVYPGFGLHPFAYVTGLAQAVDRAGAIIHGDSAVQEIRPDGNGWLLRTAHGRVHARNVLMATNGYSDESLIPWLSARWLPVISNIMVTRPLNNEELSAQGWTRTLMTYDNRMLLHYFRLLPDNRFLFGTRGGLSFRRQSVLHFAQKARAEFDVIFPHFASAETEYSWNGLVCLMASLSPFIGPVPDSPGLWLAMGWHGNGVAAASEGGRRAAQAMLGAHTAPPIIARRAPPRFLLPRKCSLRTAMALATIFERPLRPL
ncbi:MAG: NAD(P)/FAD-dependent oxidoreductase [Roseinatronobacter sp.]